MVPSRCIHSVCHRGFQQHRFRRQPLVVRFGLSWRLRLCRPSTGNGLTIHPLCHRSASTATNVHLAVAIVTHHSRRDASDIEDVDSALCANMSGNRANGSHLRAAAPPRVVHNVPDMKPVISMPLSSLYISVPPLSIKLDSVASSDSDPGTFLR